MTAPPWVQILSGEPDPECGRSDCAERATVVRTWRSESERTWITRACAEHEIEPDPATRLPGFRLISEQRVHEQQSPQTPTQVG